MCAGQAACQRAVVPGTAGRLIEQRHAASGEQQIVLTLGRAAGVKKGSNDPCTFVIEFVVYKSLMYKVSDCVLQKKRGK